MRIMAASLLLTICIQFSIVLSAYRQPQKCPCTNVHTSEYELPDRASCSCWICLNKEYEAKPTSQVKGLLGGQARYLDDSKNRRQALFINTDIECPPIASQSVYWKFEPFTTRADGAWGKWLPHSGQIRRRKGLKDNHVVTWQRETDILNDKGDKIATKLERPLPAIAIRQDLNTQWQSMLHWAQWSKDPCLENGKKEKKGMTRFAVCTYCFCISFLLQICFDTESKYPNIHCFQCIAICV